MKHATATIVASFAILTSTGCAGSPRYEPPASPVRGAPQSSPVAVDTAAAWTAARRLILQWPKGAPDSTRLVPDVATMHARFARCHRDVPTPYCELTGQAPVTVLQVKPITADLVMVEVRVYQTLTTSCGVGSPLSVPAITMTSGNDFNMILRDGRWSASGPGRGFAC
ncbi:MAG: hypothetical protein V4617_03570 [Gemmatimonadota bacterium]